MTRRWWLVAAALLAASLAYWEAVVRTTGAREPWDAPGYWIILYPAALALSAAGGALLQRRAWLAGAIVVAAQLPVMLVHNAAGAMLPVGIAFLVLLSLPATAAAMLAARLRR